MNTYYGIDNVRDRYYGAVVALTYTVFKSRDRKGPVAEPPCGQCCSLGLPTRLKRPTPIGDIASTSQPKPQAIAHCPNW